MLLVWKMALYQMITPTLRQWNHSLPSVIISFSQHIYVVQLKKVFVHIFWDVKFLLDKWELLLDFHMQLDCVPNCVQKYAMINNNKKHFELAPQWGLLKIFSIIYMLNKLFVFVIENSELLNRVQNGIYALLHSQIVLYY